ncbi:hypothetical protein BC939DRAFT_453105 [Gamsiella multidivaricata]|uniref:uncharacterized protein n=1 Tax=Gamsiella multidivaricata TaxID=101098 RepID=UPI00222082A3|nr:uncharacterized protein BC939DRAFT_453105 [Gamsiella multidivaricata]KAI7822618.1 hypothetical protein BC939DRAFT_453105 [Gamsiella multidivaricata]
MRFLRVLGNYLGITLMDVFRVIENIQRLMKDYEDSLQHFVRHSASTIQTLDFCTREVEALVEQHSIAIQELTQISSTIQALGEYYTAESEDLMNGCVTAKIVSIALSITGFAAGASMAIFVPPLAAVGAGALVATGGGISAIISQYDANKSEIYAMATAKLTMVDDYNQAFQAPIKTIFLKLSASKRQLTALQHRNSKLTTADLAESDREKSYARAQKEAEEIDRVCNEIYDYALQVTVLRGQLGAKLEQITEK